jgi:hypothetical protein
MPNMPTLNLLERLPRRVQRILYDILHIDIVVDEFQRLPKITHPGICDQYQLRTQQEKKVNFLYQ